VKVAENKCVIYEFGKFVLDPKERTLFADGVPLHLPAKEFDTLVLLVEHNGHALAKDEMISAIWRDSFVEESNLAKQISRLRKLFNTDGEEFIETLPKHGYRFNAELRRTLVDAEDLVILERRTVKRVTFALENDVEPERLALPPAKPPFVTASRLALLLVAIASIGFVTWFFRDKLFGPQAVAIDPYAPVRLTDNPLEDTAPAWSSDGRIRFTRVLSDNQYEVWIMRPDGTGQELVKMPDGKRIFAWSPDGQKIQYVKEGDGTKVYLANADGSGEILLPFRGGVWSADSKLITFHRRLSPNNADIFVYTIETREVRNVTNSDAFDADPSFSPDGKRIVFASSRDGNPEIYSINIEGTDLRRLTFDPKTDAHASFSPDGTQILFGSDRENEDGNLYLMNSDGSGVVKLVAWDKSSENAGPNSWSHDGTKVIFYSDRNGKDDVYVVSAETVRRKLVLSEPDNDLGTPVYSPDGRHILYSRGLEDKTGELRIFDRHTQETSLVTKTDRSSISARWFPDANWIAFSDRANGNSEIFRIRPDGSDLENLTKQPSSDATAVISPDGGQLVFWSDRGQPAGAQLWIMNFDGSDAHPLTPRKGWEGDAIWSPDGRSIVFVCDRLDSPGNLLDLCEINADGSGEKRLLFHTNHDGQPTISPDNKRIVFVARSDGNLELYLVNRDGSGLRRLTRDPADDQWPDWSPDGRTILFGSNRGGKFAIYELEIND
jgi:TolB protein